MYRVIDLRWSPWGYHKELILQQTLNTLDTVNYLRLVTFYVIVIIKLGRHFPEWRSTFKFVIEISNFKAFLMLMDFC